MPVDVQAILGPEGSIAAKLPGYEPRDEQIAMAEAVAAAVDDCEHLLAEAGTGVGKSFAYLIPLILHGVEHHRRSVVSTYTIALQEQLIDKDLPFLAEVLDVEFTAALGKGRTNYACLRRLAQVVKNAEKLLGSPVKATQAEALAEWAAESGHTGSRQEIDFPVDHDVWSRIRCEPGTCRGGDCDLQPHCYLRRARRKMAQADLLVVNHALFWADLAIEEPSARLLGRYDQAVLDEAHTVEQVVSNHFGASLSSSNVFGVLRQLYDDQTHRGELAMMQNQPAIDAAKRADRAAELFFAALASLRGPGVAANGRIRQSGIVENDLSPALKALAAKCSELCTAAGDGALCTELAAGRDKLLEQARLLDDLLAQSAEGHAYWRSMRQIRGGKIVALASAPIDVAPIVREHLFDAVGSAVLTSATLATGRGDQGGFDYIRTRLGLEEGRQAQLQSPFDYRNQAKLYVETRLGEPNDRERFAPAAAAAIAHYVEKTEGRCFVLFTSYSLLDAVAEELQEFATIGGYEILAQGGPVGRSGLLRRFRQGGRCILLGTMSFWQGVDVAGEALSNVIITKLPFAVPDEPLTEARIERIRNEGRNPFAEYQLPEAVILFKQGFGRLIRSRRDTGIVVVLDHRIATKSYGSAFIDALPAIEVIRDPFGTP